MSQNVSIALASNAEQNCWVKTDRKSRRARRGDQRGAASPLALTRVNAFDPMWPLRVGFELIQTLQGEAGNSCSPSSIEHSDVIIPSKPPAIQS
jgi:hypothetical protein